MSIIDTILDALGLQRKSVSPQDPTPQKQLSSTDKWRQEHDRIFTSMADAANELTSALYEQKTALVNEFAEKIRSGKLTKQEQDAYVLELFGHTDTTELSPDVQQALLDALEKRGRKDS